MSFGQYSSATRPPDESRPLKKQESKKRLKHVFGSNDTGVEHVWAHPREKDGSGFEQTDARNPQGNFYFRTTADGVRVLYSYRDSYPVGSRFLVKGKPVFLIRSGKPYSSTTSMHMSACANAARRMGICFHVADVARDGYPTGSQPDKAIHKANLADYLSRIQEEIDKYTKARSAYVIEGAHSRARKLTAEAKDYAKFFRVQLPALPAVPRLDSKRIEKARAQRAHLDATRDAREDAANARRMEAWQEEIAAWKNGGPIGSWRYQYRGTMNAFLRVALDTETGLHNVETSQGVKVPVTGPIGASRLLRFLESLKTAGRSYQSNGHSEHIGQFTVSSFGPVQVPPSLGTVTVEEWILQAGCHRIIWPEIQSIADAVRTAETKDNAIAYA